MVFQVDGIKVLSPGHISALTLKLGVCHLGGIQWGKCHCHYHIPIFPYVIQWFSSYTFKLTCYLLLYIPFSRIGGVFTLPVCLSTYSLLVACKSQKKKKAPLPKSHYHNWNPQSWDSWLGKLVSPAEMAFKKKSTLGLFFWCWSTLAQKFFKMHFDAKMSQIDIGWQDLNFSSPIREWVVYDVVDLPLSPDLFTLCWLSITFKDFLYFFI